jgi:diguanylate cyclase (GGDEF)-like protein
MAQHAMSLCQRLDHPITFLYMQLKNLGEISTLDGLNNMKSALVEFSQMLLVAFRNSDVIGRIGEHEFGVMLTGTAEGDANQPIRRLEELLRDHNSLPGHSLPLDVDMAAVRYDPVRHRSVADLLAAAAQEAVTSAQAHGQSKAGAHGG